MTVSLDALIEQGRHALRQGDGPAARRAFQAALERHESGEALEGLGRAHYLEADYPRAIAAHERAFAVHRLAGDLLGAARAARMLAWMHGNLHGDWAIANGWLARTRTMLEGADEDSAEHGWVEVIRGTADTDPDVRLRRFRRAHAIGRRHGDADLEFEALGWIGLDQILSGHVEEGMLHLDEALTAVCSGEVDDLYVVEAIFCAMFLACERIQDVTRAEQWLRAADDLARRRGQAAVGAFCRAHYGGILTAAGRWQEAEDQLVQAARVFEGGYTAMRATVLVRLADLRVRQGRLEEAEQLLTGLDHHPDAVRPLAALRLARGEVALARDLLRRSLDNDPDAASATPLLSLLVDVELAAGDTAAAGAAAACLEDLAAEHPGDYVRACAALARGRVCTASGSGDARSCLEAALAAFSRAGMPPDLARTRLELARAVASDHPQVAVAEATAALDAFERLQAARDADAAAALLRSLGVQSRTGHRSSGTLTRREAEVLDLLAHGLSNPEIADRLVVSVRTVEHHVGRILSKLGLRNRAEAAAYAVRGGRRSGPG